MTFDNVRHRDRIVLIIAVDLLTFRLTINKPLQFINSSTPAVNINPN